MSSKPDGSKYQVSMSVGEFHRVIFEAAGAATRPLLEDHSKYVFPSERVVEAINECLTANGLPPRNMVRPEVWNPDA